MAARGYPNFSDQPGAHLHIFKIDGSGVTTSATSDGLDGRGQAIATIKDDGANLQTIAWKRAFKDTPYVVVQPLTANGAANIAVTTTGMTLTGVERDDNITGLPNQDFIVFVYSHDMSQYIL